MNGPPVNDRLFCMLPAIFVSSVIVIRLAPTVSLWIK
jgi:hypothetical protein